MYVYISKYLRHISKYLSHFFIFFLSSITHVSPCNPYDFYYFISKYLIHLSKYMVHLSKYLIHLSKYSIHIYKYLSLFFNLICDTYFFVQFI
jgi:hypothetical protein